MREDGAVGLRTGYFFPVDAVIGAGQPDSMIAAVADPFEDHDVVAADFQHIAGADATVVEAARSARPQDLPDFLPPQPVGRYRQPHPEQPIGVQRVVIHLPSVRIPQHLRPAAEPGIERAVAAPVQEGAAIRTFEAHPVNAVAGDSTARMHMEAFDGEGSDRLDRVVAAEVPHPEQTVEELNVAYADMTRIKSIRVRTRL